MGAQQISEVVIGSGVVKDAPVATVTHTTTNATPGSGGVTDVAGSSLVYQSGLGTGTGTASSIGL